MTKYHVNKKGVVAICRAKKGNCPFGGEKEHFANEENAQSYADEQAKKTYEMLPVSYKSAEKSTSDKMQDMFRDLVPNNGSAKSVAGELVRAYNKIGYRFYNDGDKVNDGYGNVTCNSSFRYLINELEETEDGQKLKLKVELLGDGNFIDDKEYKQRLLDVEKDLVELIENNPELKEASNDKDSNVDYVDPTDYHYGEDLEEDDYYEEDDYDDDYDDDEY